MESVQFKNNRLITAVKLTMVSILLYKFLVAKFEFVVSFGMSLEGDCPEVEVTPNLELLVTFGMTLEIVCHRHYE
jgi:hypothetical protein